MGSLLATRRNVNTISSFEHSPTARPKFYAEDNKPGGSESCEVQVDEIIRNCEAFPVNFPIATVKCSYLRSQGVPDSELNRNINSVYPILHESALPLFLSFLSHKQQFGSNVEKKVYKDFTVEKLVDRLLKKRAVVFGGRHDTYMLLDGVISSEGWETVGTENETPPRILKNCLSYDEIKLSALLSVSSYTCFINDGARNNRGKYRRGLDETEESGIVISLIGPRFGRPEVMEYQDIIITKEQNIKEKGYGPLSVPSLRGVFINFYGEQCLTYTELKSEFKDTEKYHALAEEKYFNNYIYAKRLALSFDTLLIEANQRAKESGQMAYVFVVGIGLGIWRISAHQNSLFMDVFCERIRFLGSSLKHTSDICFSYIESPSCGEYKHGDIMPISDHPCGGIKIHIIRGNPHTKFTDGDRGKLLVVSYAGDGNSLPGNEFWTRSLTTSSDSATASSTQVTQLHNSHINPRLSAKNLKIATPNGIVPFREYVKNIKPLS